MATSAQWLAGARPRTLPAAVAPVLGGTGVALHLNRFTADKAALALIVALALQVGVNYANDYSDGIRGTDDRRAGPLRLVGSGVASPRQVRNAALAAFAVAAAAGTVLATTTSPILLVVGAAALAAAWLYTGGRRPYGYRALGEVSVFLFFGVVAVVGTTYVQAERLPAEAFVVAVGVGALACAILVANNLRDISTDRAAGKRTLAVVVGDAGARRLFMALHAAAYAVLVPLAAISSPAVLLGASALPLSVRGTLVVRRGATGGDLVAVLKDTASAELVYAVGVLAGYLVEHALR